MEVIVVILVSFFMSKYAAKGEVTTVYKDVFSVYPSVCILMGFDGMEDTLLYQELQDSQRRSGPTIVEPG